MRVVLLLLLLGWRLGAADREGEHAGGDPGKATKEVPFRNSLGMEFVPVKGGCGVTVESVGDAGPGLCGVL